MGSPDKLSPFQPQGLGSERTLFPRILLGSRATSPKGPFPGSVQHRPHCCLSSCPFHCPRSTCDALKSQDSSARWCVHSRSPDRSSLGHSRRWSAGHRFCKRQLPGSLRPQGQGDNPVLPVPRALRSAAWRTLPPAALPFQGQTPEGNWDDSAPSPICWARICPCLLTGCRNQGFIVPADAQCPVLGGATPSGCCMSWTRGRGKETRARPCRGLPGSPGQLWSHLIVFHPDPKGRPLPPTILPRSGDMVPVEAEVPPGWCVQPCANGPQLLREQSRDQQNQWSRGSPGRPVAETPHLQCRGLEFDSWLGD